MSAAAAFPAVSSRRHEQSTSPERSTSEELEVLRIIGVSWGKGFGAMTSEPPDVHFKVQWKSGQYSNDWQTWERLKQFDIVKEYLNSTEYTKLWTDELRRRKFKSMNDALEKAQQQYQMKKSRGTVKPWARKRSARSPAAVAVAATTSAIALGNHSGVASTQTAGVP
jgi:hypothetical protein